MWGHHLGGLHGAGLGLTSPAPRSPPATAAAAAVSFAADSLQSGAATPEPTANLTFDGSDATGVSFTCTLSARWASGAAGVCTLLHGWLAGVPAACLPSPICASGAQTVWPARLLSCSGTVPLQPEVYSGTTKMNMQQVGGGWVAFFFQGVEGSERLQHSQAAS